MCLRGALLPSTDALYGARYLHGDDRRRMIPGVLETPLKCGRQLRQLGDLLTVAVGRFRQFGEVWRGLKGAALIVRCCDAVALGIGAAQARGAGAVGAVHEHHCHVRGLMMAGSPEGWQGRAKHEVPIARGMNDVLVWSGQLYPQGGATAPAARAATATEVGARLCAARVALDETAIAQAIVEHNGLGLQQLAQFVAHHPAGEPAVLDVLLGLGISISD